MAKAKKYVVLVADIVSSRNINDRNDFQKKFSGVIQNLRDEEYRNNLFNRNSDLTSPFTVTLGDEYQAVYDRADNIFRDAFIIMEALHPIKTRFSYGIGTIATDINKESAIGMDGEAFYNARDGIDMLKDEENKDNIFILRGLENKQQQELYNNILYLISKSIKGWKINRSKIFGLRFAEYEPRYISELLDITPQAIYKNIDVGNLDIIQNIFFNISESINKYLEKI